MPEYATNGKGNLGVTLGAIGTGLGVLGGMTNIGGIFGGTPVQYATKESVDNAILLAQKDSEIALLKSEQNTEVKIADVYERIMTRVNADRREQDAINAQQAVYNGTNTAMLSCMQNQIAQLMSLTALRIPNTSVCPGWGAVTVTPVAPTAATTTAPAAAA